MTGGRRRKPITPQVLAAGLASALCETAPGVATSMTPAPIAGAPHGSMDGVVAALTHTPWWVFLIFFFVLSRGIAALQTRVIAMTRLAIVPLIFAVWGAYSLFKLFGLNLEGIGIFAVALLVGVGVGLVLSRHGTVRADQTLGLVEVSGSPVTLILVLIIFISKYALGYWVATEPSARDSIAFLAADAIVSGLVIGIFAGRFAGLRRRYKAASPSALTAPS